MKKPLTLISGSKPEALPPTEPPGPNSIEALKQEIMVVAETSAAQFGDLPRLNAMQDLDETPGLWQSTKSVAKQLAKVERGVEFALAALEAGGVRYRFRTPKGVTLDYPDDRKSFLPLWKKTDETGKRRAFQTGKAIVTHRSGRLFGYLFVEPAFGEKFIRAINHDEFDEWLSARLPGLAWVGGRRETKRETPADYEALTSAYIARASVLDRTSLPEDWAWAKAEFGGNVKRDTVRDLRRDYGKKLIHIGRPHKKPRPK